MAKESLIVLGHDLTDALRFCDFPDESNPDNITIVCPRCGRYIVESELADDGAHFQDHYTCDSFLEFNKAEYWIDNMLDSVGKGYRYQLSNFRSTGKSLQHAFRVTRLY